MNDSSIRYTVGESPRGVSYHERIASRVELNQTIGLVIAREAKRRRSIESYIAGDITFKRLAGAVGLAAACDVKRRCLLQRFLRGDLTFRQLRYRLRQLRVNQITA